MAPVQMVIDLTSSPEPDAPCQVLKAFAPRKRKSHANVEVLAKRTKDNFHRIASTTQHVTPADTPSLGAPYAKVVAYEVPLHYIPPNSKSRYSVPEWTISSEAVNASDTAVTHAAHDAIRKSSRNEWHVTQRASGLFPIAAATTGTNRHDRPSKADSWGICEPRETEDHHRLAASHDDVVWHSAPDHASPDPSQSYRQSSQSDQPWPKYAQDRVDSTSSGHANSAKQKKIVHIDITDDSHEIQVPSIEDVPRLSQSSHSSSSKVIHPAPPRSSQNNYTDEENMLLKRLKEVENCSWDEIVQSFPNRSRGSLQVHYCNKVKRMSFQTPSNQASIHEAVTASHNRLSDRDRLKLGKPVVEPTMSIHSESDSSVPARVRSRRNQTVRREVVGSVASPPLSRPADEQAEHRTEKTTVARSSVRSLLQPLRARELGMNCRRAWASSKFSPNTLLSRMSEDGRFVGGFHKTSGDVITMSWSPDGNYIAAGSIAISDPQSQQYNMVNNLLLGDMTNRTLFELPEHHITRPIVEGTDNPNALHSMRASQDERLFMSLTAVEFSSDSKRLYSCGTDRMLRQYTIEDGLNRIHCDFAIEHQSAVNLLSLHRIEGVTTGLVATGTHALSRSINVFACNEQSWSNQLSLSPNSQDSQELYPSAVKFGSSHAYQNYLLAGFSADTEKDNSGETCLWDMISGARLAINTVTHNVFDIAWNSAPSSTSVAFAVACNPAGIHVNKQTRSVVQCFAPNQGVCKRVLVWECPALDINDVVFCPYDDHLIAAGATNGKVYVWDQRFADRKQQPLLILEHGESLNVLDDQRSRELTDTGVQMLMWGPTRDRVFTGSSDGVVKIWTPYNCQADAHLNDLEAPRAQRSAVMSGIFDPDYQQLLVGREDGQLHLFDIGRAAPDEESGRSRGFSLVAADVPLTGDPLRAAKELLRSGEIVIQPCGAMPFRRAVQGPNYRGPYMVPTEDEVAATEALYQEAVQSLGYATLPGTALESAPDPHERMQTVQAQMDEQQGRRDWHFTKLPAAEEFERSLCEKEHERRQLEISFASKPTPCQLDCKVIGASNMDGEVDDSGRSQSRIPHTLRHIDRSQDLSLALVQQALQGLHLSAKCIRCARVTKRSDDVADTTCEICDFACFRCAQPAAVSADATSITCHTCQLVWEAGALGYDLVGDTAPILRTTRATPSEDALDLLEFYGSLWQSSHE